MKKTVKTTLIGMSILVSVITITMLMFYTIEHYPVPSTIVIGIILFLLLSFLIGSICESKE